jgi:N-acetylglucosaminyl-diphospho-decaprenol L-rhamnosyltransferase
MVQNNSLYINDNSTTIDIVIVNWNSGEQISNCLKSISSSIKNVTILKVIVVDNASNDGSADNINNTSLPLQIIQNSSNMGFAKACNQGAESSVADYILFLNPDTVLFHESIDIPVVFMNQKRNEKVGICGIQLVNESGAISFTCSRFPSASRIIATALGLHKIFPNVVERQLMIEWNHQNDREVDQVMGAFFLIRRDLFDKLDGFDTRFFVYYEEVDLAFRARKEGYSSHFVSSAQAFHKGGGTTANIQGIALFYYLRSRILYCYKHFNFFLSTFIFIITITLEFASRLMQAISSLSFKKIIGVLSAYTKLYTWIISKAIPLINKLNP